MSTVTQFNPFAPETIECPYPFSAAMRHEAPVHGVPGIGFFIVSRYEDLQFVLTHPELFSSKTDSGVRKELPQEPLPPQSGD